MRLSKKSLMAITCGIGFLVGGLAGLAIGFQFQSELAVVIGYGVGATVGTFGAGLVFGPREES